MRWVVITGLFIAVLISTVTTAGVVNVRVRSNRNPPLPQSDPKSRRHHIRKPGVKTFNKDEKKINVQPEVHIQKEHGEKPPSDDVKQMVQNHATQIKNRAQLPVVTDEDRADLNAAPLDALSYTHYQDEENEIYLVKIIIGNLFVIHVKIAAKRLDDKGVSFHPDVANSVVMMVLPDKKDTDKLSREEFDNPQKAGDA